ncbi:MAG: hypothetical protein Tsb005_15570 [Gammaproteobacteria bacterium]
MTRMICHNASAKNLLTIEDLQSLQLDPKSIIKTTGEADKIVFVAGNNKSYRFNIIDTKMKIPKTPKTPESAIYEATYAELPSVIKQIISKPEDEHAPIVFQLAEFNAPYAKTTVLRTLMHRELIQKTKKNNLTQAQSGTRQLTLSQIHAKAIMGSNLPQGADERETIELYFANYNPLNLYPTTAQKNLLAEILKEEANHPNKFAFYHAVKAEVGFMNDVVTECLRQLKLEHAEDFAVFRAFTDFFTEINSISAFKEKALKARDNRPDYNNDFRETGIAVGNTLFGSSISGESPLEFFINQRNIDPPKMKEFLLFFFRRFQVDIDYVEFEKLFKQFFQTAGGVLYQILIDQLDIDQLVVPTSGYGVAYPLKNKVGEIVENPSHIFAELKKLPTEYLPYWKEAQSRMYLDPRYFHDAKKVQIKAYYAHPIDEMKYRKALANAVGKIIVKILAENKAILSEDSQPNTVPKLQKHMRENIYGNVCEFNVKTAPSDYVLRIPQLVEKADITGLVDLFINFKDVDLTENQVIPNYLPGQYNIKLSEVFANDLKLKQAVVRELKSHVKNYPHLERVIEQLRHDALSLVIKNGNHFLVPILLNTSENFDLPQALVEAQLAGNQETIDLITAKIKELNKSSNLYSTSKLMGTTGVFSVEDSTKEDEKEDLSAFTKPVKPSSS